MPGPVTTIQVRHVARRTCHAQGGHVGHRLYQHQPDILDRRYDSLPREARDTIALIIKNGPFPYPGKDGSVFGNRFGDLPDEPVSRIYGAYPRRGESRRTPHRGPQADRPALLHRVPLRKSRGDRR